MKLILGGVNLINKSQLISSNEVTEVFPSDNIFRELGNNTYTYKDLLSEFIDNSIAASIDGKMLNIEICIYFSANKNGDRIPKKIIVRDDAKGIEQALIGKALSPGAIKTEDSLNEHGMGMKQAIAGMGELDYLATKISNEDKARVILELKYGKIETYYTTEFKYDSGTEICITNLKAIVSTNPTTYAQHIVPYLGARYRYYLKPENKRLNLNLILINEDIQKETNAWNIKMISPIYYHPYYRSDKPVIYRFPIKGEKWEAELTFGYAPANKYQLEQIGVKEPKQYEPYYVSLSKQGIDIVLHDRIILFHQFAELGIVGVSHPSLNTIRGELILKKGFSTAITKNYIIEDSNYKECISRLMDILTGEEDGPNNKKEDYVKVKTYPERLPHPLVLDRLGTWLTSSPIIQKENIDFEYTVEGIDGHIDILADGEAWELKLEQASALDVYQLFMYMDIGNISKGYLIAKSFSSGAKYCAKYIKGKHEKEIILDNLDNYPINQSASADERKKFFRK